jgi:ABC-type glycerol-3-phosphate transport system permease component
MKIKDQIIIGLLLGLWIFHFAIIILGIITSFKPSEEILKKTWLNGYNKYISDYYIPAPGLPEQKDEIPVKKPNPKLKEKFKG